MDLRDPIDEDGDGILATAHDKVCVVKVTQRTQKHLTRSFISHLRNAFTLPLVTKTPSLDVVMVAQCSKSTKANEKSLTRIQALMLDAIIPLTKLLDILNNEEKEVTLGYAVAITLLGMASAQMSTLRHQKVLEEYNKDLLSVICAGKGGRVCKGCSTAVWGKVPWRCSGTHKSAGGTVKGEVH